MPYKIVKRKGPRPYKIIRKEDGKVVGSSTSKGKAQRSIGYRMEAEKPGKTKKAKPTLKFAKNKAYAKYRKNIS